MSSEQVLKTILRFFGSTSLLGAIFVVAPRAWMDAIHSDLGMGALPDAPVVGYLARSTSAFYAMLGGLFWLISFDLRRYRQVLIYLGAVIGVFGVALFGIDWFEGMPPFWMWWEGPVVTVLGITIFLLGRKERPGVDGGG